MPAPYFPFTGETYQPQMGLKPLAWVNWLEFDETAQAQLALKRKLFQEERASVLQIRPGSEGFCLELHERLREHLLKFHPDKFQEKDGFFQSLITSESFSSPKNADDAMEQISRWAQEDWCLLNPDPPHELLAAFVCFPSRWSLAEKMGKAPEAVHGPVPDYKKHLAKPVMNFFQKITPEKPMWRLNWTIHDSDELFCPGPFDSGKKLTAANVIDNCYLRVERQTLCRLPKTGAIAFSIRTHIAPLREVIAEPGKKALVYHSLVGLPEETAAYRGMGPFLPALKAALKSL